MSAARDGFAQAIDAAGMTPPLVLPPGEKVRFPGAGKSHGNRSGWAFLFQDEQGGVFGDWSSGLSETWRATSCRPKTAAERTADRQRVAELQRIRDAEKQRGHAEAASEAQQRWDAAKPATKTHAYLMKKQVTAHGLRVDDENKLLVPVMIDGTITSLQTIDDAGVKRFLPGGEVKGGSVTLGEVTDATVVLIAEGFATAASLYEATNYPVVVAFDAGNLKPVAMALRTQHPTATIVLCGDNDIHHDGTPNTGREAATAAATAIGGRVVMPEMDGTKCDWNDVHVHRGLEAVKTTIELALRSTTMMSTTPTREDELIHLALLSPAAYGAARIEASARLGIPLTFLDKEWELRRKCSVQAGDDGQGRAIEFEEILPAFEPVNGADLADRLAALFTKFAVLPDFGAVALTLWTVFTYCIDLFQIAPRLDLSSPEKRCGKTTVLRLLFRLVCRSVLASNVTPAAIFRVIAAHKPTLLIDEMDTFIEASEELRGILNSGHTREAATIIRCDGEEHEPRAFSTWAAMAFAHIGTIPDTLEDRSIRIPMRRKLPGEYVASLPQTGPVATALHKELDTIRRQIVKWIGDHSGRIGAANPSPIDGLSDRGNDNWTPLLAIADILGGTWPDRARTAAAALSGRATTDNESIRVELLIDIRDIFASQAVDRLSSAGLCDLLTTLEERPWGTWKHDKPMTPVQLARLLKPFGVTSRTIRFDGQGLAKGYLVEDFSNVFGRYTPSLSQDFPILNRNKDTTRAQSGDDPLFQTVTETPCYVSENGLNPAPRAECVSVTVQNGEIQGDETMKLFSEGGEEVVSDDH